jgi:hypothetical protein
MSLLRVWEGTNVKKKKKHKFMDIYRFDQTLVDHFYQI